MAKTRIYELAREFNMTNTVLLEKIKEIGISVKSHMSVLDDETVGMIQSELFSKKPDAIEEVRIKPTVIRRRKRSVSKKAVPEPKVQAEEVLTEKKPEDKPASDKTVEESKTSKASAKIKKVEKKAADKAVPKKDVKEKVEKPSTIKKVTPKKKKVKKEVAAKIIKLPTTPVEKTPRKIKAKDKKPEPKVKTSTPSVKAVPKVMPLKTDLPPKEVKGKKRKKKTGEKDGDRKFFEKKISFRKKAVVEAKDLYSKKRRGRKDRKTAKGKAVGTGQKTQITTAKAIKRRIKIDETIILSDLAKRMGIKAGEMIKALMTMGVMATVNQTIDFDTAVLVASEFDYEVERAAFEEEIVLKVEKDDPDKMVERAPVVTIMGHVDHGKTSLLDVIRKTRVTAAEAGGITQHIGAYNVMTDNGRIVFLDTPGHEAFTAMRGRGAKMTDIVVLVVAADDGVMPQTIEAINHSKAAGVPIIVAVNKIDKANADTEKVYRELSEEGLTAEDWGGDTIFARVSAKQNTGIDELLEMILLQSEVLELKANPEKPAKGYVVESKIDPGRGAVATVLIQDGTLHAGDPVVCGIHYGKVRALLNDRGRQVESAGPSIPVEVIGLTGVPMAGDELIALSDEKSAKQVSIHRVQRQRSKELAKTSRLSLEKLYEKIQEGELKDLNIIIKADVHGSIEAISDSLTKLSNEEVKISVIHSATGTITESDISLAAVSDAIIIGFNVRPSPKVQAFAGEENVDIRFYNIIYDVINDIKSAIVGMMSSTFEEKVLGLAEVREVFHVPKVGSIAGCHVTDGKIERGQLLRLVRDGVVLFEGKNSSLRRFKDDVKEVQSGYECGIGIENYNDIKVGDVIECYYLEEIKPEL
ncbi:MAG: translation initiation factor IF-2 [Thermodesulfobacteriota bacterium]|nr:translation initiation factor IF-2 [Thermodesulfobacteriota bacterium]